MSAALPTMTPIGELLLATMTQETPLTLAEFVGYVDDRPEVDLGEEACRKGLEALVDAGLAEHRAAEGEQPEEWWVSPLGMEVLTKPAPAPQEEDPEQVVAGPVSLELQPGKAHGSMGVAG